VIITFKINKLRVFRRVYNITKTIIDKNLRAFIDFISLELKVSMIYLVVRSFLEYRERR
jgi:hypothetical protein